MNRALTETLRCLHAPANMAGNCTDMRVLERQQDQLQQQIQRQQQRCYLDRNGLSTVFCVPAQASQFHVKSDPSFDSGWPEFGIGSGFEMNYGISTTTSSPPAVAAEEAVAETKQRESGLPEKMMPRGGRQSLKKRKADKNQNLKAIAEHDSKGKRVKGCFEEGDSKKTEQSCNKYSKSTNNKNNSKIETSADTLNENSKVFEVQKPDYIHVRACRGQATDSHSLAERVRREKISKRMKYLQDLVPGCNKITGKAGMLDEIINYVQSLQRQVEFLSMKLAAVNPMLDIDIDNFSKEVFPSNFPIGLSSEITNPAYLQFNPMRKLVSWSGLEMGLTAAEIALRRTIIGPVLIQETFLDSSCFNHIQPSTTWDTNLQNLFGAEFFQGRSTTFQSQQFTG